MPLEQLLNSLGVLSPAVYFIVILWKGDDFFSKQLRQDFSRWLKSVDVKHQTFGWLIVPKIQFDRLFGSKLVSPQAVIRSLFLSAFFTFVPLIILFFQNIKLEFRLELSPHYLFMMGVLVFSYTINFVFDFVSVTQTRYLLTEKNTSICGNYIILIDLILTLIIVIAQFLVVFLTASTIFNLTYDAGFQNFYDILNYYISMFDEIGNSTESLGYIYILNFTLTLESFLLVILFLTSIYTTLLLWVTLLSMAALRKISKIESLVRIFQYAMPIDTHPIRSLGIMASVITILLGIGSASVSYVFSILSKFWL